MLRLGIIGTAGRTAELRSKLNQEQMIWMSENVEIYVENVLEMQTKDIILVSGGSAWADHVAVQLYKTMRFAALELHLPADFDVESKRFVGHRDGHRLNELHMAYTDITGIDSLAEIAEVIGMQSVCVTKSRGFFARNKKVAERSEHLLGFGFSPEPEGGSLNTWSQCKSKNKLWFQL